MEEFKQNSSYKSTWQPLSRENEQNIINTPTGAELIKKNSESDVKTTEKSETPELSDIYGKLAEISADINTLNNMLADQQETIGNLYLLLRKRKLQTKKRPLDCHDSTIL